jgi:hypothetical protein
MLIFFGNKVIIAQNCFQSATDVNFYLSANSVFENSSGIKIAFSDMGAICNSGSITYMNPEIRIISNSIARLTYTSVTISGYSVTFIINCKENIIIDSKDNAIYRKGKNVYDKLGDLKEEIYQDRLIKYKKYHENETFNYINLDKYLTNNNIKNYIPTGGTFYFRDNRFQFYSMISEIGGYVVNGNLFDDYDNQLGTIKSTTDYYYLDFDTKHKYTPRYRVFMNKKDQINENVVEKRVFSVGIINLNTNEKYIHKTNELWVDAASNPLNVIAGAIQLIIWNTMSDFEKLPDSIELDSNYIKSINNLITNSVNYDNFVVYPSTFKRIDSITWSEKTNSYNGIIADNFRWRTYAIDSNYLYLQKIMIRELVFPNVLNDGKHSRKVYNLITYIGDGEIMLVPINLKDKQRSSKAYTLNKGESHELKTNNWWGQNEGETYITFDNSPFLEPILKQIDNKPFIKPQNFIVKDCEKARNKYLEANPDVKNAKVDPWNHYNIFGKNEGRKWFDCNDSTITFIPENCEFSRNKYLEANSDVKRSKYDPWYHYIHIGKEEGRQWFDCNNLTTLYIPEDCIFSRTNYLKDYPDVKTSKLDPWFHYTKFGQKQGRIWINCVNDIGLTNENKLKQSQFQSTDTIHDGVQVIYRDNGTLQSKIEYKNGKMNGTYERYDYWGNPDDIKLSFKFEMKNGLMNGRCEYYVNKKFRYLNGKLDKKRSGYYVNGNKIEDL